MEGTTYGYVRVSTREQNGARQLAAMREFGVEDERIIVEKLSGKAFCRPRYQRQEKGIAGAKDKGVRFGRGPESCRIISTRRRVRGGTVKLHCELRPSFAAFRSPHSATLRYAQNG